MNNLKSIREWIFYNLFVCFAVYWLSNFVLCYPWSINERLGQILMLTINPLLWGLASYVCIIRYPGNKLFSGVLLNSLIFIFEAIISDLVFFACIRNAMNKLMEPTTIYGWAFVVVLPFLIYLLFRKQINKNRKQLIKSDYSLPLIVGLLCLISIVVILIFNIRFDA